MNFTGNEVKVLEAIPRGGGTLAYVVALCSGIGRSTVRSTLVRLEEMGLVEREPNAHGPETPWWYVRLPQPADDFRPDMKLIVKDAIFDRGRTEDRTWIGLTGKLNEHGCAEAWLHAGTHNPRKTWVPLHLLQNFGWYVLRRRGVVTAWSAQFSCETHGECTVEMVRTDKTCALCGSLLNRH